MPPSPRPAPPAIQPALAQSARPTRTLRLAAAISKRVAVPIWTTPDEHLPVAADAPAVAGPEISAPARTRAGSKRSTARTPTPSVRARQTALPATSPAPASSKPKTSTARVPSSWKSPDPTASALESAAAATPPPPALPRQAAPAPSARARPVRHTPIAAVGAKRPARAPKSMAAVVSCPYCAEPLESPPVANVRCSRCRQRIVVRRAGDRFVYLTEAALPVFIAQRRRRRTSAHGRASATAGWRSQARAAHPQSALQRSRTTCSRKTWCGPRAPCTCPRLSAMPAKLGVTDGGRTPVASASNRRRRCTELPGRRSPCRPTSSNSIVMGSPRRCAASPRSPSRPSFEQARAVTSAAPTTADSSALPRSCARRACPMRIAREACAAVVGPWRTAIGRSSAACSDVTSALLAGRFARSLPPAHAPPSRRRQTSAR